KLRRQIDDIGDVVLVIIDPISAYMGDKIDPHQITSVRAVMSVVADFAEAANVAVLAIHHPPKDNTRKAIHHFSGSLAFAAAPRLAFVVAEDKEHEERYLLLPVKSNLGPLAPGRAYYIVGECVDRIFTSTIKWDYAAPVTVTASEALRAANSDAARISKLD